MNQLRSVPSFQDCTQRMDRIVSLANIVTEWQDAAMDQSHVEALAELPLAALPAQARGVDIERHMVS